MIFMKDFSYDNLMIEFSDGKVEDIEYSAPFFYGICNAKIFFDNLELNRLKMNLFTLEPFVTDNSEEPLKVTISNSKFLDNYSYDDAAFIGKTNSHTEVKNSLF